MNYEVIRIGRMWTVCRIDTLLQSDCKGFSAHIYKVVSYLHREEANAALERLRNA